MRPPASADKMPDKMSWPLDADPLADSSPINIVFEIRLKAFNRSLDVLDLPESISIWKDKTPEIFTTERDEAALMVATILLRNRFSGEGCGESSWEDRREEKGFTEGF